MRMKIKQQTFGFNKNKKITVKIPIHFLKK